MGCPLCVVMGEGMWGEGSCMGRAVVAWESDLL